MNPLAHWSIPAIPGSSSSLATEAAQEARCVSTGGSHSPCFETLIRFDKYMGMGQYL